MIINFVLDMFKKAFSWFTDIFLGPLNKVLDILKDLGSLMSGSIPGVSTILSPLNGIGNVINVGVSGLS